MVGSSFPFGNAPCEVKTESRTPRGFRSVHNKLSINAEGRAGKGFSHRAKLEMSINIIIVDFIKLSDPQDAIIVVN